MFFKKKKKDVRSVFSQHYRSMLRIAKSSPISNNPEFELLPAMFTMTDFAAMVYEKDRMSIAVPVMDEIKSLYPPFNNDLFDRRCDLYGEIIRGRRLRNEWAMGDSSVFTSDAMQKCTALLGDILINPDCADDYDNAPLVMHSVFDVTSFSKSVVVPILEEIVKLINDIHDL